jgi:hypothetical protein
VLLIYHVKCFSQHATLIMELLLAIILIWLLLLGLLLKKQRNIMDTLPLQYVTSVHPLANQQV